MASRGGYILIMYFRRCAGDTVDNSDYHQIVAPAQAARVRNARGRLLFRRKVEAN